MKKNSDYFFNAEIDRLQQVLFPTQVIVGTACEEPIRRRWWKPSTWFKKQGELKEYYILRDYTTNEEYKVEMRYVDKIRAQATGVHADP